MKVYYGIKNLPTLSKPCSLTVGKFDGVHAGHQHLISMLKKTGIGVAIAFTNQPGDVISSDTTPLICPIKQKLALLEKHGIDVVISIPYTTEIAELPFEEFIQMIKKKVNFTHLYLGKGARFGKEQRSEESAIKHLGKKLEFDTRYLSKITSDGHVISTLLIRELIEQGKFCSLYKFLKRPYSLSLDFSYLPDALKWTCDASGLCLPPSGEYSIGVVAYGNSYLGLLTVKKESSTLDLTIADLKISQAGQLPFELIFPTCE